MNLAMANDNGNSENNYKEENEKDEVKEKNPSKENKMEVSTMRMLFITMMQ